MRKNLIRFGSIVSVFALVGVLGLASLVQAQDATTAGQVTCDQDLILSLYVAERYLGFNDVQNQFGTAGGDTSTMVGSINLQLWSVRPAVRYLPQQHGCDGRYRYH